MNAEFLSQMQSLYQQLIQHDAYQTDRDLRYRNIKPESAHYISMLIKIQTSKRILEIGTSTGYLTLWMAEAVSEHQGRVTTVDINSERTALATQYAKQFSLDHLIDFISSDAIDLLINEGDVYDLIILDANRHAYPDYWQYLKKVLHPEHGLILVDKVISHAAEIQSFLKDVKADPDFCTMTLNIGCGLLMITRN